MSTDPTEKTPGQVALEVFVRCGSYSTTECCNRIAAAVIAHHERTKLSPPAGEITQAVPTRPEHAEVAEPASGAETQTPPQPGETQDLFHAQHLAKVLAAKFYPENPTWEVGDNLPLVLDQISNACSGLTRVQPPPPGETPTPRMDAARDKNRGPWETHGQEFARELIRVGNGLERDLAAAKRRLNIALDILEHIDRNCPDPYFAGYARAGLEKAKSP